MRSLIFGEDSEQTLRDEIEEAIDEAEDERPIAGDLTPTERQMLRNLLHFGERTAGDICVTRGDIMAVPATISFDDLVRAFADAEHSRLPVYGESLDEVIGMIHIKDVFKAQEDPTRDRSLPALLREPLFIPESMGAIDLLARMREIRDRRTGGQPVNPGDYKVAGIEAEFVSDGGDEPRDVVESSAEPMDDAGAPPKRRATKSRSRGKSPAKTAATKPTAKTRTKTRTRGGR
jgi:hypothetical protein